MVHRSISLPNLRITRRNHWRVFWLALAGFSVLVLPSEAREEAKPDIATPAVGAVETPSSKFTPEDVVQKQMQALSAGGPVAARIDRCYRFASPANREHTGPIERFSAMVQSPPYQALFNAKHFLVGRATQHNNEAFLLVTVIDSAGELTLFRCFLSKQNAAPYKDCWMTDAVIRVGTMKPADKPRKPQGESPTI